MDKLRSFGLEQDAVVLELGSRWTKCGYAGEFIPRHVLPTPSRLSERGLRREDYISELQDFLHLIYFQ